MPVTVYPPYMGSSPDTEHVTIEVAQTWRIGATGSLQLLDNTSYMVAEWAANQWGYVETGTGAAE